MPGNYYGIPDYYGNALLDGQSKSNAELQKMIDQWDESPWWRKFHLLTFTMTEGDVSDRVKAARHILLSRRNPDGPTAKKVARKLSKLLKTTGMPATA